MVSRGRERPLSWALGIFAVYMFAEIVGGLLANSLALLADAGHKATDVAALGVSLWAMRLAERPPGGRHTYGYQRAEILAALSTARFSSLSRSTSCTRRIDGCVNRPRWWAA